MLFCSCNDDNGEIHPYANLTETYFDSIADSRLSTNSHKIREYILKMSRNDNDSLAADYRTRSHYRSFSTSPEAFLWIDRNGISSQADSLLACLDSCESDGFAKSQFRFEQIKEDLNRLRNLTFTDDDAADEELFNQTLARLEYNLTKAFLRYGVGQRYGFVNPNELLNRLDVRDSDSVRVTYRTLFDIPIHIAGKQTFSDAISSIRHDSVAWYLRQASQHQPIYNKLKAMLNSSDNIYDRRSILLNMEKARWHTKDYPGKTAEYVVVNIPAYHLWAVRDNKVVQYMKIGCGSHKTKTPLLYSAVKRMDINPQWIIPGSIRTKEMAHHGGDAEYFYRNRYFARNKKTGEKLTGEAITHAILMSHDWSIVQQGGSGNSLGRIIFRFDNNFSIYVHDTSSRGIFSRDNRAVSHGCIRVERPYDLACYMLRDDPDNMAEKVKYSMENDIDAPGSDKSKFINSIKVEPTIPIYIVYFTLFPQPDGEIKSYPDVYGYDKIISDKLQL